MTTKLDTKVCSRCGEELPVDAFAWRNKSQDKRQPQCRSCRSEAWKENHPPTGTTPGPSRELVRGDSKRCSRCRNWLPFDEFHKDSNHWSGLQSECKSCRSEVNAERMEEGYYRAANLRKKYGMTQEDYETLLAEQGGVCAICGDLPENQKNDVLVVDHCHTTGSVRGLLCEKCNLALGLMGDDMDRLTSAVAYLMANED